MKRKQEKQNNTKHSLKKLIALWVVFVLLVVPFANHVSGRDDAKAEGETQTTTEEYYTAVLTENPDADKSIFDDVTGSGNNYDNVHYYLRSQFGTTPTQVIDTTYFADEIKMKLQVTLSGVDHSYHYGESDISKAVMDTENFDIQYVALTDSTSTPDIYRATIDDAISQPAGLSSYTNGVAVYIKPQAVRSEVVGDTQTYGISLDNFNAKMGYTLLGIYRFKKETVSSSKSITWQVDSSDVQADSVYNHANLNEVSNTTGQIAGTWKYKYIKANDAGEPSDDSIKKNTGWSSSLPAVNADTTDISDGTYYGYAGYFVNNADGTQTLLTYVATATPVALDVTAPSISAFNAKCGETEITLDELSESKVFYMNAVEKVTFGFEVGETGCTVTTTPATTLTPDGTSYTTSELSASDFGADDKFQVTLTDVVGNSETYSYQLGGSNVQFQLATPKFAVSSAKIMGTNGTELALGTSESDTVYVNNAWKTENGPPILQIQTESDQKITPVTTKPTADYAYQIVGVDAVDVGTDHFDRPIHTTTITKELNEEKAYSGIAVNTFRAGLTENKYGTVICDYTAPEIIKAELQYSNDGTNWNAVNPDDMSDGNIYYINYAETTQYRYYVSATDALSGVKEITSAGYTYDAVPGVAGAYTCAIDKTALPESIAALPVSVIVTATDKAGNVSGESTLPRLAKQNAETEASFTLKDGENVIDLTGGKVTTNKQLTLTVDVTSSVMIQNAKLNARINGVDNSEIALSREDGSNQMDPKTKMYTKTYTFTIPAGTDVNKLIENGIVTITTNDPAKNLTKNVRDILYDVTKPTFKVNDGSDAYLKDLQVDWTKDYNLSYKILSGENANVESPIASASYKVENTTDMDKDGVLTGIDTAGNTGEVSGAFEVPESATTAGTRVYMTATDEAGNTSEQETFVKVDATKPEIGDIVVTGYTDSKTPVVGTPTIRTLVSDNLTIRTGELKLTYPDGTVKKVTVGPEEAEHIQRALEYQLESSAPDGDYSIEVFVEDKVGNSTSKAMAFRLDNTAPIVTVKITDGTTAGKQPMTNFDGTSRDYYYGSDVTMLLTYEDTNISSKDVVVTDNGTKVNVTWTQVGNTNKYQANYAATTEGKHVLCINATDEAGNPAQEKTAEFIKDTQKPTMTLTVNGKSAWTEPIEGAVKVQTGVSDNQTLNIAKITVVGPNAQTVKTLCDAGDQLVNKHNSSFALEDLVGNSVVDGDYAITVEASDKAGNTDRASIYFRVDNTVPVVTAKIADGVTAGKQPGVNFDGTDCDFFYRSDVAVLLTYEDNNIDASSVVVTDNGTPVAVQWTQVGTTNKYQAVYQATRDGAHTIKIGATDKAGNKAEEKQIVFIRDTAAPVITAMINGGMVYNESMGVVDLTSNAVVSFSVNDTNEDVNDFNYQLIKTLPDENPVTADVLQTDNRSFGYSDEADYVIKAYSVDKAGNRSAERTIQFRIDKTAPELNITGTASGSTLNAGTTLTFSMTEAFWRDASGTITITRKANDSTAESNYKTIDFKPTARVTTLTETLSETGEYKVTFTGKDRAGHTAEAATYTVRIDTGKPVITLSGVSNNDKTTKQVEFQAQIEEDFYLTKSVSIQATRTYLDPESYKEKTEDLQITGYNPTAATTLIRNTFTEDGIYKIQVICKDAAGNEDTQEVSFTIDKTSPVIDPKVMSAYQGTLTSFAWDYDLNDIIYDLTVCDTHMYLNGSEYDGTSKVEDGAYEMKITAEDELGNATEETVNFNLDTKAPTFIVTGVEDGEIKNAQYDINVSLQLDEDTLDEVTLNGSAVEIKDNAATITVTEKGDYKLAMKAHDDAGNVAEKTISFTYGEKSQVLLYVLIGVGTLVLLGGGTAIILAAKKKK